MSTEHHVRYNIVKLRMLTESKHFVCMHVKPESDEPWDLTAIIYLVLNFFIPGVCANSVSRPSVSEL